MDTAEGTFSASPCCLFYRPNKAETRVDSKGWRDGWEMPDLV